MTNDEKVAAIILQMVKDSEYRGTLEDALRRAGGLLMRLAQDILASGTPYLEVADGKAIMCLRCGMVSYNPHDVEQRYCGACHLFLEAR